MKPYTIVLNGFSKAFAMTGWRIGYVCCPEDLMKQVHKLHQYSTICAPIMSQYGAAEGLRKGFEEVEKMRISYQQRRNLMYKAFIEMGLPCTEPEGAFYIFPDIRSTGLSSEEFFTRLLNEYQVAVVPGSVFGEGGEGFIRCCYPVTVRSKGDETVLFFDLDNYIGTLPRKRDTSEAEPAASGAADHPEEKSDDHDLQPCRKRHPLQPHRRLCPRPRRE